MAFFKGMNQAVTTKAPDYLMMGAAGVIKYGEERLFSSIPLVGNGTLKSAVLKGVCGVASKELLGGFWGNAAALAFATDAVEDALYATIGPNPGTGVLGSVIGSNNSAVGSGSAVLSGAI